MSDLFKEMFWLTGQLSDFVDFIKDEDSKRNLLSLHVKVTDLCEKISSPEFDEDDDLYWETIDKILGTERVINSFKENHINLTDVIDHFNTIIENVENFSEI